MAEPCLSMSGVHCSIGMYGILQGVDLEVPAGEVTVVLGRNGAGKTTTMRTVIGELAPSRGSIVLEGREVGGLGSPEVARLGVGYVPEQMNVFLDLTVRENLVLAAHGRKSPDKKRLDSIFDLFPPLQAKFEARAGVLSGGQKQMLSIARILAIPRRLAVIDEPTKGLAPSIVNALAKALRAMVEEGVTVLLVEQNIAFATKVAKHARVMDDGRIVRSCTMAELAADEQAQRSLLGLSVA